MKLTQIKLDILEFAFNWYNSKPNENLLMRDFVQSLPYPKNTIIENVNTLFYESILSVVGREEREHQGRPPYIYIISELGLELFKKREFG